MHVPPRELVRFGAIGDIHGEDVLLARALDHLDTMRLDAILSVGDIVDGAGEVSRCLRLLRDRGVIGVRGNHDRWVLEDRMRALPHATLLHELDDDARAHLESLPATRTLQTPMGPLLLMHGLGDDDMARLHPDDDASTMQWLDALPSLLDRAARGELAMTVGGHTHVRMVRRLHDLLLLNPGTLVRDDAPCFMTVDLEAREVKMFELDERGGVIAAERYHLEKEGIWGSFGG